MKVKIALLVLAVVALALAITLLVTRQKAAEQQKRDAETIAYNSSQWQQTQVKLDDEKQTNTRLNQDLDSQKKAYVELTNTFTQVAGKLGQTETTLATTAASLKTEQEKVAQREAKIAELQAQNNALDVQAAELTTAITNLTGQIEDTQRKLAASEGDKAFLQQELKRLMAEKADLERQFNDLKILRAQVAKLKEELNISRRWEWIRKGLAPAGEQKGASLLLQGANAPSKKAPPAAHYDLNVEVNSDGSVRVIPPLTNAPAATPPSK
jgi:chromosome segregation ATPase